MQPGHSSVVVADVMDGARGNPGVEIGDQGTEILDSKTQTAFRLQKKEAT